MSEAPRVNLRSPDDFAVRSVAPRAFSQHYHAIVLRHQSVNPVVDHLPILGKALEVVGKLVSRTIARQIGDPGRTLCEGAKFDVLVADRHPVIDTGAARILPAAISFLEHRNMSCFRHDNSSWQFLPAMRKSWRIATTVAIWEEYQQRTTVIRPQAETAPRASQSAAPGSARARNGRSPPRSVGWARRHRPRSPCRTPASFPRRGRSAMAARRAAH